MSFTRRQKPEITAGDSWQTEKEGGTTLERINILCFLSHNHSCTICGALRQFSSGGQFVSVLASDNPTATWMRTPTDRWVHTNYLARSCHVLTLRAINSRITMQIWRAEQILRHHPVYRVTDNSKPDNTLHCPTLCYGFRSVPKCRCNILPPYSR